MTKKNLSSGIIFLGYKSNFQKRRGHMPPGSYGTVFVISNNKSFIPQNLKAVGPWEESSIFSVPRDLKFKTSLTTEPQKSSSALSEL